MFWYQLFDSTLHHSIATYTGAMLGNYHIHKHLWSLDLLPFRKTSTSCPSRHQHSHGSCHCTSHIGDHDVDLLCAYSFGCGSSSGLFDPAGKFYLVDECAKACSKINVRLQSIKKPDYITICYLVVSSTSRTSAEEQTRFHYEI